MRVDDSSKIRVDTPQLREYKERLRRFRSTPPAPMETRFIPLVKKILRDTKEMFSGDSKFSFPPEFHEAYDRVELAQKQNRKPNPHDVTLIEEYRKVLNEHMERPVSEI